MKKPATYIVLYIRRDDYYLAPPRTVPPLPPCAQSDGEQLLLPTDCVVPHTYVVILTVIVALMTRGVF